MIQGLKGLEFPAKYAEMFAGKKNIMSGCFFSLTSGKEKGLTKKRYRSKKIRGGILFLTSTNDESVPAKRDAELLTSRLRQTGFAHSYKHINFENGSHNLGYFPVNNIFLPQEKKRPEECQEAREKALEIILQTLESWDTEQL